MSKMWLLCVLLTPAAGAEVYNNGALKDFASALQSLPQVQAPPVKKTPPPVPQRPTEQKPTVVEPLVSSVPPAPPKPPLGAPTVSKKIPVIHIEPVEKFEPVEKPKVALKQLSDEQRKMLAAKLEKIRRDVESSEEEDDDED